MRVTAKLAKISLVVIGIIGLFSVFNIAYAKSNTGDIQLDHGQTHHGAFIHKGQTITIDGTVDGDVILAGQTITIDGTVTGNVYAVAQTITIHGTINGNAHLAGSSVEIAGNGRVKGSLYAAGATVKLDPDTVVDGGLFAAGSTAQLDGIVRGQVYAAASTVTLSNTVDADVIAAVGQLDVNSGAKIAGNLKYYSKNDANIDNGAKIAGSVTRQAPKQASRSAFFTARVGGALFGVIGWFLIGLILLAAMPKQVVKTSDSISKQPWQSFGVGLLFTIVGPIIILIGLITVVGVLAAIVAALLYVAILMISIVFVSLWFGRLVLSYKNVSLGHNLIALLIGLVVLVLLRLLPLFGGLITFVAFTMGTGAVVRLLWSGLPKSSTAKKSTN